MSIATFTLRIHFTGICALVPNDPDPELATSMYVVLPGCENVSGRVAADGSVLRTHRPIVRFRACNLLGVEGVPGLTVTWPIHGKRLTIAARGSSSAVNDFHIVTQGETSIYNLVHLDRVAPDFGILDSIHIASAPSELVQAQVFVQQGRLCAGLPLAPWRFPATLVSESLRLPLAQKALLELTGLHAADLVAESLRGEANEVLRLAPGLGDTEVDGEPVVEVTIANFCGEDSGKSLAPLPDEDFKWYFQLVPSSLQEPLRTRLDGLPLPIPYPILEDSHFINYGNCYPAVIHTIKRLVDAVMGKGAQGD
ncbi:MAG TPA: hypothetical protein VJA16_12695 [Thermoanaerobaculia bacterium]